MFVTKLMCRKCELIVFIITWSLIKFEFCNNYGKPIILFLRYSIDRLTLIQHELFNHSVLFVQRNRLRGISHTKLLWLEKHKWQCDNLLWFRRSFWNRISTVSRWIKNTCCSFSERWFAREFKYLFLFLKPAGNSSKICFKSFKH